MMTAAAFSLATVEDLFWALVQVENSTFFKKKKKRRQQTTVATRKELPVRGAHIEYHYSAALCVQ
jgi:hypothetical protein